MSQAHTKTQTGRRLLTWGMFLLLGGTLLFALLTFAVSDRVNMSEFMKADGESIDFKGFNERVKEGAVLSFLANIFGVLGFLGLLFSIIASCLRERRATCANCGWEWAT